MDRWSKLSLRLTLLSAMAFLAFVPTASAVTVTADAPAVTEGNSGTVDAVFTVTCEATDVGPVAATAAPGSAPAATPGSDYEEETVSSPPVLAPCALLVPLTQK